MSIRPVDYTSLISKTQELSKIRQVENDKFRNQTDIGITQQQKQIDKNFKTVRDINKTENLTIDANKEKEKKRQKNKKKNGENKKKDEKEIDDILGGNIDIRI
ncbi:MAG: hypothetical protein GX981_08755 [Tissierellia bacterium]|nr:hypothetical protein [Tissierellia bacterium]